MSVLGQYKDLTSNPKTPCVIFKVQDRKNGTTPDRAGMAKLPVHESYIVVGAYEYRVSYCIKKLMEQGICKEGACFIVGNWIRESAGCQAWLFEYGHYNETYIPIKNTKYIRGDIEEGQIKYTKASFDFAVRVDSGDITCYGKGWHRYESEFYDPHQQITYTIPAQNFIQEDGFVSWFTSDGYFRGDGNENTDGASGYGLNQMTGSSSNADGARLYRQCGLRGFSIADTAYQVEHLSGGFKTNWGNPEDKFGAVLGTGGARHKDVFYRGMINEVVPDSCSFYQTMLIHQDMYHDMANFDKTFLKYAIYAKIMEGWSEYEERNIDMVVSRYNEGVNAMGIYNQRIGQYDYTPYETHGKVEETKKKHHMPIWMY